MLGHPRCVRFDSGKLFFAARIAAPLPLKLDA